MTQRVQVEQLGDGGRNPRMGGSVLATALAFFVGVGVPCWSAFGLPWGVALGAMCAFWGGLGFGVMVYGARLALFDEANGTH